MPSTKNVKPLSNQEREQIERRQTFQRIIELELDPVRGNFDAAHLKEINRRIFQDLPGAGFKDVLPGEYRPPVLEGKDWMKHRVLSTVPGSFYVAYSRMDQNAQVRLDQALVNAKPSKLRALSPDEFMAVFKPLYAELDYLHPFSDGNSRTLRTFTKQLARESGYELDWERFNASEVTRDLLYIARDRSVNKLAKPHVQNEQNLQKVMHSMDRLEGNKDLFGLLREVIRPSRAAAFEKLTEVEAIQQHPELTSAYQTLHAASVYFTSKFHGSPEAQQQTLQVVAKHIQEQLNRGEIRDFGADREAARLEHSTEPPQASEKLPGLDR